MDTIIIDDLKNKITETKNVFSKNTWLQNMYLVVYQMVILNIDRKNSCDNISIARDKLKSGGGYGKYLYNATIVANCQRKSDKDYIFGDLVKNIDDFEGLVKKPVFIDIIKRVDDSYINNEQKEKFEELLKLTQQKYLLYNSNTEKEQKNNEIIDKKETSQTEQLLELFDNEIKENEDFENNLKIIREHSLFKRDKKIVLALKILHDFRCQICGKTIQINEKTKYSEIHHIIPLSENGHDIIDNMLCVCPNHHVMLDYGVIPIEIDKLIKNEKHIISQKFIQFHNEKYKFDLKL